MRVYCDDEHARVRLSDAVVCCSFTQQQYMCTCMQVLGSNTFHAQLLVRTCMCRTRSLYARLHENIHTVTVTVKVTVTVTVTVTVDLLTLTTTHTTHRPAWFG